VRMLERMWLCPALRRGLHPGPHGKSRGGRSRLCSHAASRLRAWRKYAVRTSPACHRSEHDTASLRLSGWLLCPTFRAARRPAILLSLQWPASSTTNCWRRRVALAYQDVLSTACFFRLPLVYLNDPAAGRRQRPPANRKCCFRDARPSLISGLPHAGAGCWPTRFPAPIRGSAPLDWSHRQRRLSTIDRAGGTRRSRAGEAGSRGPG